MDTKCGKGSEHERSKFLSRRTLTCIAEKIAKKIGNSNTLLLSHLKYSTEFLHWRGTQNSQGHLMWIIKLCQELKHKETDHTALLNQNSKTFQGQFLIFQGLKITEVGLAIFIFFFTRQATLHNLEVQKRHSKHS